ncbi:MAG: hypothetical protein ACOYMG_20705, partial [Candidatus Methylumidiphilus sp.]
MIFALGNRWKFADSYRQSPMSRQSYPNRTPKFSAIIKSRRVLGRGHEVLTSKAHEFRLVYGYATGFSDGKPNGLLCQQTQTCCLVEIRPSGVVLALVEVSACPWLRSPSSQTAKGRT